MKFQQTKNTFRKMLIWLFISIPMLTWAHQPDVSATMLVENENNEWILRVTSSASALEYEVKKTFGENAYKTKEEFEKLALEHVRNNLKLTANGTNTLKLYADMIKIGHETQILFKVAEMPAELHSITVKNSSFKDIHHHQGALMILKNGFEKKQFLLNNGNEHTLELTNESNKWIIVTDTEMGIPKIWKFLSIGFAIALMTLVGYKLYQKRNVAIVQHQ